MKKLLAILSFAPSLFAFSLSAPQPIDWRFRFVWEDPNAAGVVQSWTVYASNNVAVRMSQTRVTGLDLQPLLNGAPAGVYALFNTATSELGDVSEPSTNLFVRWPGGSGRLRGGAALKAEK